MFAPASRNWTPLDTLVFRSPSVTVATFRCPVSHPRFRDSGPIENDIFVFPRRVVRLCHEGGRAFVADPTVVTLYNRGQRYGRTALNAEGDDCEWFAVERGILLDAVRHFDPRVDDDPGRPFRHSHGPCDPRAYLAQRELFEHLSRGESPDRLAVEEGVVGLLAEVLAGVYGFWRTAVPAIPDRQVEAVEHARRLLSEELSAPLGLSDVAREAGLSVFHLCRAFRRVTGTTLHALRNRLRLQHALERLAGGDDLTTVALDLGYSSHSHFTGAFRQLFGVTPSSVRRGISGQAGKAQRNFAKT